ncbi:hypothetical protein M3Y97_00356900 [Aphelenchoides bicaudatus]|nr:hypothetical protein M3Y97_00356900 [Aphelenchoides bicaudatus]
MSILRSHRLSSYAILHQRSALCFSIDVQQRRNLGLYKRYENFLETKYPRVYKVHRLIIDGCRSCGRDIKTYFYISRDLRNGTRSIGDLDKAELLAYIQVPLEFYKLIALLVILQIPGPGDLIILAAVFFPRYVLTRHFWTESQKQKFWQQFFNESYRPQIQKNRLHFQLSRFPKIEMPDFNDLDFKHLLCLFRLHNISLLSGTHGLKKHATLLSQLDKLMLEDQKSIDQLSEIELQNQLYVRRVDYANKSKEEMAKLLKDWVSNLKELSDKPSLYLHAPVLLQINK